MKRIMRKNKTDRRKKKQGIMRGIAWILSVVIFIESMNVQAFAGEVSESEMTDIHTEETESSVSGADVPENKEENAQEPTAEATEEEPAEKELPEVKMPDMSAGAGTVIGQEKEAEPTEQESVSINSVSFNSMEIDMQSVSTPVTFAYNGYPYGQISDSNITLTTALASGEAEDIAWYRADAKDGTYTEISGATGLTYTFTAQDGTAYWYKCQVNGQDTYPVQVVYASNRGGSNAIAVCGTGGGKDAWYISNGSMAYTCGSGNGFDVIGKYQQYWISTSYSGGWATQNAANIIITFNTAEEHAVEVEAQLLSGQTSFAIDADVCLGNSTTSGNYSDSASLKAVIENEQVTQIQMVGAASVDDAKETDPAFVLKCVTGPSSFYLSKYSNRYNNQHNYNTSPASADGAKKQETVNGTANVVTEVAGIDSGMAMGWTNVTGGKVRFNFNIGTVNEAGAQIKANAVVTSKTVIVTQEEGNIGDFEYNLRDKTTGKLVSDTWKVPDTQTRQVTFEDLTPNHSYEIIYRKRGSSDSGESAGDTTTAIDPLRPDAGSASGGETKPDVEVTITYHSISYKYLESNYQYRLLNEDNSAVTSWQTTTGIDGALTFDGLKPGVTYYLVAKTSSNSQTDKVPYTTDKVMVTYHANASDVSGLPQEQEFAYGDALSDRLPVKEGYDFLGWNIEVEKENTEARYSAGQIVDITEPTNLYACWKIKCFSVTASDDVAFTVEGGDGTVAYGKSYQLKVFPRAGYILKSLTAIVGNTVIPAEQISYQEEIGVYTITLKRVTEDQNVQIRCSYTTVLAQAAEDAKTELKKNLADKKKELQNLTDLSEKEKAQYQQRLEEIEKNAEEQMDLLTDIADETGIRNRQKEAEEKLTACINDAKNTDLSNAKEAAKGEIAKKAEAEKNAIDAMPELTETEKNEWKQRVDDVARKAQDAINAVTDPAQKEQMINAKETGDIRMADARKAAEEKNAANDTEKKAKKAAQKEAQKIKKEQLQTEKKAALQKVKEAEKENEQKAEEERERYLAEQQKYAALRTTAGSASVLGDQNISVVQNVNETGRPETDTKTASVESISGTENPTTIEESSGTENLANEEDLSGTESPANEEDLSGTENPATKEEASAAENATTDTQNTRCIWHWIIGVLMLLSVGIVLAAKRRKPIIISVYGVNVTMAVLAVALGSCRWDLICAIADIWILGATLFVSYKRLKKEG